MLPLMISQLISFCLLIINDTHILQLHCEPFLLVHIQMTEESGKCNTSGFLFDLLDLHSTFGASRAERDFPRLDS